MLQPERLRDPDSLFGVLALVQQVVDPCVAMLGLNHWVHSKRIHFYTLSDGSTDLNDIRIQRLVLAQWQFSVRVW